MSYTYIFEPIALTEYKEAIAWYKERSFSAAENFIEEVKEKITLICKDLYRFRNTHTHFRETVLRKYPFSIIYFIDEAKEMVIISSVFHQKRNPEKKYKNKGDLGLTIGKYPLAAKKPSKSICCGYNFYNTLCVH